MIEQQLELLEQHDFMKNLNEYQKEAVIDESKALLLNAHVGSGKTTVLIAKILYLSLEKNVDFSDMVVLTFTNKAANEIKERIKTVFPEINDEDIPYIGTFHSIAKKLLADMLPVAAIGYTKDFTIIDPEEMLEMANRLIIEKRYKIKYRNKLLQRLEDLKKDERLYGNMKYEDDIDLLWDDIVKEKREQNKMDFDDLIYYATQLLKGSEFNPKWIIVDEFQDSDEAQFEFLKALSKDETKLFVVGDPNQIIYTWRGSDKKIFEKYKEFFHAKELSLPINYRSTATILDAAKAFLADGSKLEGIRNQGNKIKVKNHYNPFNEAQYLSDQIKQLVNNGLQYKDIAILYRTQRQSKLIEEVFKRETIPFEVSLRKTLKDVPVLLWFVSVLKASINEKDKNNVITALSNSHFGEGLTRTEINELLQNQADDSSKLFNKIKEFKSWSWDKNLNYMDELYRYFELDDFLSPTSSHYAEHKEMILQLIDKMKEYIEGKNLNLFDGVVDFVNSSTLYGVNILEETTNEEDNSVKLMTLHACKGLEFKKVFMIGANNGLLPLRTKNNEEYEEEKRLFFVGMTRAKDELEISYYTNPDEYWVKAGPSTFLSMIPEHLMEKEEFGETQDLDIKDLVNKVKEIRALKAANEEKLVTEEIAVAKDHAEATEQVFVRHRKYGEGIVESEDEQSITIKFEGYGSKTFAKMFVQLEYL